MIFWLLLLAVNMWTLYLPMRLELFNTCYILTASGINVLSGASGRVDKWEIDINVRSSLL